VTGCIAAYSFFDEKADTTPVALTCFAISFAAFKGCSKVTTYLYNNVDYHRGQKYTVKQDPNFVALKP
jgi:hypothetical protein